MSRYSQIPVTIARDPSHCGLDSQCGNFQHHSYLTGGDMKTARLAVMVMMIAITLFILFPSLSWAAEDGAAIYKSKCAVCHGADASGKPGAKIPSLISDEVKKM